MIRTMISLDPDDKAWLRQQAHSQRKTMAQIIREAIKKLRAEHEADHPPLETLLERTRGIWNRGDGLAYQEKLRDEWT